jgi:hypothetical protein
MTILAYHKTHVHLQKANLVDLGLYLLARGEWQLVLAITRLIEKGGMRHA